MKSVWMYLSVGDSGEGVEMTLGRVCVRGGGVGVGCGIWMPHLMSHSG